MKYIVTSTNSFLGQRIQRMFKINKKNNNCPILRSRCDHTLLKATFYDKHRV